MAKLVRCPNCNQLVESSNNFCIFCDTRLPTMTGAEDAIISEESMRVVKKCKHCGEEYNDASLKYCPKDGYPFEENAVEPVRTGWECRKCKYLNFITSIYCENCGNPKESKAPLRSTEKRESLPEGMYLPTENDLKPKKRVQI